MSAYRDMTDGEIATELAEYRAARKKAVMGGVGVVAGEGRRMEFFKADVTAIDCEIREMLVEMRRRGLAEPSGGSLIVEIG